METVILTNKVCSTLAKIYKNGFKVDVDKLEKLRLSLRQEKIEIEERLKNKLEN